MIKKVIHNISMRFILPVLLAFLATSSHAGTISRLYDFEPNTKAEADKVDAEFDNIIDTVNGNLDSENFLDGGIATADLGSNVVIAAKINDGAVIAGKLGTSAVATANIASAAVTKEKLATANIVSSIGNGATNLGGLSGPTTGQFATATITTVGRPVLAQLTGADQIVDCSGGVAVATRDSYVYANGDTLRLDFFVNSATRSTVKFGISSGQIFYPCSSISQVIHDPAGTYTYRINVRNNAAIVTGGQICNCKLVLQEL